LQYLEQRYYDPAVGRFLSPDPTGYAGGLNLYSYVKNDPVNWVDPQGLYALRPEDLSYSSYSSSDDHLVPLWKRIGRFLYGFLDPGISDCYEALSGRNYWNDNPLSPEERQQAAWATLVPFGSAVSLRALSNAGMRAQRLEALQLPHGNKGTSQVPTHVYRVDGPDGLHKIGESSQGTRKRDGASIRGESQSRKLQRKTGDFYSSRIRRRFQNKAEAKAYEKRLIQRYSRRFGRPPGNPVDR
jgi:uncharacterized protein RhaS with RHS repeats